MKKNISAVLILLLIAAVIIPARADDQRIRKAQIFIQNSNFKEAVQLLEKVVAGEPSDADARYLLGIAYIGTGENDKAIEQLERVLNINPDFEDTYARLAALHAEKKDFVKAFNIVDLLLLKKPKAPLGHYAKGVLFYKQQKVTESAAAFSQAVLLEPKFAHAFANLGLIYYNEGKHDKALENFNKAIFVAPNEPEFSFSAGWIAYRTGDKNNAYRHFDAASRMNPPHVYSVMEKALKAYDSGNLDETEERLKEADILDAEFSPAKYLRAKVLIQNKKYKEADELVKKMLEDDPLNADALELAESLKKIPVDTEENKENKEENNKNNEKTDKLQKPSESEESQSDTNENESKHNAESMEVPEIQ